MLLPQVWFIEKCRHLEVEKLGLITKMRDMDAASAAQEDQRRKTVAANQSLKALVTEMTEKVKAVVTENKDLKALVRFLHVVITYFHRQWLWSRMAGWVATFCRNTSRAA